MGNCCTKNGLEGGGEMQIKPQTYSIENISTFLNHDRTSNMFKISSLIDNNENMLDFIKKQEIFYKNINDLILNSNTNRIATINMESLWNITKYYKHDFTDCPYILYDLRKKEKKTENFLKKYKCINYNIGEIKSFSGNKLRLFKNFIKNKNIIIIPKNSTVIELKKISDLIDCINDESIYGKKYYVLSDLLNIKDEEIPDYLYKYKLIQKIDDKDFEIYPNILFPLNIIKYLNNYNYIYIQQKEMESSSYLSNKDFVHFLKFMNIKLIIDLDDNYKNEENIVKIPMDDKIDIIENNKNSLINSDIFYFKINSNNYFNNNIMKQFLYYLRFFFLSQGTLLIFYNDALNEKKDLSKWISFILSNSFFIYDEEEAMLTESEIIAKNIQSISPVYFRPKFVEDNIVVDIEEYYSNRDYTNDIYDSKQSDIIQGVKNLWQIKKEKNIFFEIICVIEKLILNLILNPGNEKFYKIKKSSRTIQNWIINIPEANFLFQMIGFKTDDKNEFYSVDKNIDITIFEDIHKILLIAVNKIINEQDY